MKRQIPNPLPPILHPYAALIAAAARPDFPGGPTAISGQILLDPAGAVRVYACNAVDLVSPRELGGFGREPNHPAVAANLLLLSGLMDWWTGADAELHRGKPVAYLAGYAGRSPGDLFAVARELNACVVDIRLKPFSSQPGWSGADLAHQFRGRYRHIPDLGNENYKSGGGVKIRSMQGGIRALRELQYPPILLCGCRDSRGCHRAIVATALEGLGWRVLEFPWPLAERKAA